MAHIIRARCGINVFLGIPSPNREETHFFVVFIFLNNLVCVFINGSGSGSLNCLVKKKKAVLEEDSPLFRDKVLPKK